MHPHHPNPAALEVFVDTAHDWQQAHVFAPSGWWRLSIAEEVFSRGEASTGAVGRGNQPAIA